MPGMTTYEARTRRWTRIEYEKLIDLGIFRPGEAVELIGGELIVSEPQGALHYTTILKTARALEVAFGTGWVVRTQGPIGLDDDSEPEPDVAVVRGSLEDYRAAHPSRPALTVEVAESSLDVDRERKGSAYARAGLADYWIVNLIDRVLEVCREPAADPSSRFGWRYARRDVVGPPAEVRPLAMPSAVIRVADLLRERSPHGDGSVARPDRAARRRMRDRGTPALDRRPRGQIDQAVLAQRPGSPRVVLRDRTDSLRGRGRHAAPGRGLLPAVTGAEAGISAA